MRTVFFKCLAISSLALLFSACGGSGSGDDSRVLLQGTLTENGGAEHSRTAFLRHGAGARIGAVEICGLGECFTTDDDGQWLILLPEEFKGGEVLLTVNGHGIASSVVVSLPGGITEALVELSHVEGGLIEAVVSVEESNA